MISLAGVLVAALLQPLAAPLAAGSVDDPRWVFYSRDPASYASPWWQGRHRTMIGYGCTRAPYYSPDPRCRRGHGFHHGVDYAMPCGTTLYAGRRGVVVRTDSLGPAYGTQPLLVRNRRLGVDFLLGHTANVRVQPGDRVRRGDVLADASDSGAPDGCHLHFEVRAAGGGLSTARRPIRYLDLEPAS